MENKNINKNGLVKNKDVHYDVIKRIINSFKECNIYIENLTYSPLRGEKSGNIEYLALFSRVNKEIDININEVINQAYKNMI